MRATDLNCGDITPEHGAALYSHLYRRTGGGVEDGEGNDRDLALGTIDGLVYIHGKPQLLCAFAGVVCRVDRHAEAACDMAVVLVCTAEDENQIKYMVLLKRGGYRRV